MRKIVFNFSSLFVMLLLTLLACSSEDEPVVELDESPYIIQVGDFPEPDLPTDNALTIQGVKLGKQLFFDKRLSRTETQSCGTCHNQADAFSDTMRFSLGVRDLEGARQAMGIFNLAYNTNGFFWDGRAELLRHQALLPIQDSLEMDETLENVVEKLMADEEYPNQFTRAFGTSEINEDRIALAIEQFMLSITSTNSKYDQFLRDEAEFTPSEQRGHDLYFAEYNPFFPEVSGADCQHCHGGFNFENDQYMNNGLDTDMGFSDFGRELATGNSVDRAQFKVPSLRNIAVTPPYMHDGRFQTLEEVIQHYNNGINSSSTLDPALVQVHDAGGLGLSEQDISDLVDFLGTLTDEDFLTNSEYMPEM